MPYLSLGPPPPEGASDVKVVAIVRGGSSDGQVLAVHTTHEDAPAAGGAGAGAPIRRALKAAGVPAKHHAVAVEALGEAAAAAEPAERLPAALHRAYEAAVAERTAAPKHGRDLDLGGEAHFELVPSPDPAGRDAIYVAAPPGAGKSHVASAFARKYAAMWGKERPIYLMSKNDIGSDPVWAPLLERRQVKLLDPETLRTGPIDVAHDFEGGALVVLDDLLDAYGHDAKMEKAVVGLASDLLDLGRRHRISVLVLNHELTAYKRTRGILNSCHAVLLFPAHTPAHTTAYFLRKIGCAVPIPELRRLGRSVYVSMLAPQLVMGTTRAFLAE